MNISPVGLKILPPKINFKGNPEKPDFEPNDASDDDNKNSASEVFISPEVYLAMMQKANAERRDEKLVSDIVEASLNGIFTVLKGTSDGLRKVPDDLKGKIPVFMTMNADDYIKIMEKRLDNNEEASPIERRVLEALKTTKYDELDKALADVNESINYLLYRAIGAARLNDPWGVINTLSNCMAWHIDADVVDNDDGTSILTYRYETIELKVFLNDKHKATNARCTQAGEEWFSADFREDESLDKIRYVDLSNKNQILIKINPKNNDEIAVVQTCPVNGSDFAIARKYKRQKDGTLKLISTKTFMK